MAVFPRNPKFTQGGETLAAEAVQKVKEAEERGKDIIREATDQARRAVAEADRSAADRRKSILAEAAKNRQDSIDAATLQAEKDCEALLEEGARDRELLLSPDPGKFDGAVKLIVERIVRVNGDS
jgi:V/A-type H+-transporting ATPase subunit G/H